MSQAAPGYVFSRQTPPTSRPFSSSSTSSSPARRSAMAMARPPNPAPMMTAVQGASGVPRSAGGAMSAMAGL